MVNEHSQRDTQYLKVFVLVVFSAVLFWGCVWLLFSRHASSWSSSA